MNRFNVGKSHNFELFNIFCYFIEFNWQLEHKFTFQPCQLSALTPHKNHTIIKYILSFFCHHKESILFSDSTQFPLISISICWHSHETRELHKLKSKKKKKRKTKFTMLLPMAKNIWDNFSMKFNESMKRQQTVFCMYEYVIELKFFFCICNHIAIWSLKWNMREPMTDTTAIGHEIT